MRRRIERPAETPVEAYHYWHKRWCEILSEESRREFVEAGLAGASFTERVPDTPDGSGYFSYAITPEGRLEFMEGDGQAIAEYDNYESGFRMLSEDGSGATEEMKTGNFRVLARPDLWAKLVSLLPILRRACRRAIEEAEAEFDLKLPKYW